MLRWKTNVDVDMHIVRGLTVSSILLIVALLIDSTSWRSN